MPTSNPKASSVLNAAARNVAMLLLLLASPVVSAADLLYVFDSECGACRAFDHDIGDIYPKTEEARIAPLRRLNINMVRGKHIVLGEHQVQLNTDIIGTPTFILISDGREVDRFSGYSRDEMFWMSLQHLLNKLPAHRKSKTKKG